MGHDTPPWEPPLAGTEAEHVTGSLERLRATFRWKADGLNVDRLRARPVPSTDLSVGGLLKHLAVCEDDIFAWKLAGQAPETRMAGPQQDFDRWQFAVGRDETAQDLYAMWEAAVARSRARLRAALAAGGLDQPGHLEWDGERPSLRRLVFDLIEEYARHTGHLDLLREAIDGRVGEDPPADWPVLPAAQPSG
ncbi:mycothiol transferase [Ornithinicoccus halotolerans]|uniref:mycothiol transferase n=1 Tax=Ornithinicoccus halotolerans TaxID=1748220 RepID=UPI001296250F|nr:DUF664 domain-containing protein [Ornithinicoccus halotolerans]